MKPLRYLAVVTMLIGVSVPMHAHSRHGSVVFSHHVGGTYAWRIAWDNGNAMNATEKAIDQCREYGVSSCIEVGWFQDARRALAISDENGYGTGWGATKASTERDVLPQCRSSNNNCRTEVTRWPDSREAGRSGRTAAKGEACHIFFTVLEEQANWSGPCEDGLAAGEGEGIFEEPETERSRRKWIYRGHALRGRFHGLGWLKLWKDSKEEAILEGEFREGPLYDGTVIDIGDCSTNTYRKGQLVNRTHNQC